MSPRTPVAIVLGSLVTISLFGLMQAMVTEPRMPTAPSDHTMDPWVPVGAFEPTPPPTPRKVEPRPTAGDKPQDTGATSLITENTVIDGTKGPRIPFTIAKPTFDPDGTLEGSLGSRPGSDEGGCGGTPQLKFMVAPDYPRAQRAAGVEGEVVVEFVVGADGRVTEATVLRATPRGAFEATTLRSVKRWVYQAQATGCADAPTRMRETVSYRLEGIED